MSALRTPWKTSIRLLNYRVLVFLFGLYILFSLPTLCFASYRVSSALYDNTSEKLIKDHNSNTALIPASLQKLVISTASLDILGKDFYYSTGINISGSISDNTLSGIIKIVGRGDPTLKYSNLLPLVYYLRTKDIDVFKGCIIIDAEIFDDEYYPQSWAGRDGPSRVYSRISGFNINNNLYEIRIDPESESGYIVIPEPDHRDYDYIKRIMAEQSSYENENRYIRADDIIDFQIKSIIFLLEDNGIEYYEYSCDMEFHEYHSLRINSADITKIIRRMNIDSNNMIAEALLKTMGYYTTGKQGSAVFGINALESHFMHYMDDGIKFFDGSGFSRNNRLSSAFIINILKIKDISELLENDQEKISEILDIRIPDGIDIYYKTGSIWGVRSLAGYIEYNDEKFIFAIILNASTGKDLEFSLIGKYLRDFIDEIIQ